MAIHFTDENTRLTCGATCKSRLFYERDIYSYVKKSETEFEAQLSHTELVCAKCGRVAATIVPGKQKIIR